MLVECVESDLSVRIAVALLLRPLLTTGGIVDHILQVEVPQEEAKGSDQYHSAKDVKWRVLVRIIANVVVWMRHLMAAMLHEGWHM